MSIEPSPESSLSLPPDHEGTAVPLLATRMTEREIAVVLDLGHVGAFGVSASQARLSVAWAMICHETGRGLHLWNYALGNVDVTPDWHGDRFTLTADEGEGAGVRKMTKWLRAYPDAYSGAVGWWRYLADHHGTAMAMFDTGDGDKVGAALKSSFYYTGSEAAYQRELRLLAAEFVRRMGKGRL